MLILGINGSPNKDGVGAKLLTKALGQSKKEGAETELIHLTEHPNDLEEVLEKVKSADGIIFCTPTYWFNVSALMKNFLEKLTVFEYPNFELEGKVAGLIATCEEDRGMQAIQQMFAPLNHLGFMIPPYATFFFNKNLHEKSEGEWMNKEAQLIGGNVVKLVKLTKSSEKYPWDYDKLK